MDDYTFKELVDPRGHKCFEIKAAVPTEGAESDPLFLQLGRAMINKGVFKNVGAVDYELMGDQIFLIFRVSFNEPDVIFQTIKRGGNFFWAEVREALKIKKILEALESLREPGSQKVKK